jgi:hypothetical protein
LVVAFVAVLGDALEVVTLGATLAAFAFLGFGVCLSGFASLDALLAPLFIHSFVLLEGEDVFLLEAFLVAAFLVADFFVEALVALALEVLIFGIFKLPCSPVFVDLEEEVFSLASDLVLEASLLAAFAALRLEAFDRGL